VFVCGGGPANNIHQEDPFGPCKSLGDPPGRLGSLIAARSCAIYNHSSFGFEPSGFWATKITSATKATRICNTQWPAIRFTYITSFLVTTKCLQSSRFTSSLCKYRFTSRFKISSRTCRYAHGRPQRGKRGRRHQASQAGTLSAYKANISRKISRRPTSTGQRILAPRISCGTRCRGRTCNETMDRSARMISPIAKPLSQSVSAAKKAAPAKPSPRSSNAPSRRRPARARRRPFSRMRPRRARRASPVRQKRLACRSSFSTAKFCGKLLYALRQARQE
jgi:hypothetical protein